MARGSGVPPIDAKALIEWAATHGAASASMAPWGGSDVAATEATDSTAARTIVPYAGRFSNLRVIRNATPGAGTSVTYTLRVNGVNSALTCTMGNGPTTASDLVNSVAVAAGDSVEIIGTISGAPGGSPTKCTVELRPA